MTLAICVRCGADKFGSLTSCPKCGLEPDTQREQAYSLAISDHYFTEAVLRQIGNSIAETGRVPSLPPDQLEKLLAAVRKDPNSPWMLSLAKANNRAVELRHEIGGAFSQLASFPVVIFQMVAGADGKIDKKEREAFENVLRLHKSVALFKSELMRALAHLGEKDAKHLPKDQRALFQMFVDCIGLIRDHVLAKHLTAFEDDVSSLALIIANSSGGFFGLSNRVSKVERNLIDQIVSEARKLSLKPRMHLLPQARIIVVAQQCIGDIETLFMSVNVTSQNLEVLGFVTMGLDFVFQSMTKENIYRRELNALISHLSHTYKVPRNDIASVVAKRADMYAILISKALATMGVKLSDGTELTQLAWDIYANVSGGIQEMPPLGVITELPIIAMTYILELVKIAEVLES